MNAVFRKWFVTDLPAITPSTRHYCVWWPCTNAAQTLSAPAPVKYYFYFWIFFLVWTIWTDPKKFSSFENKPILFMFSIPFFFVVRWYWSRDSCWNFLNKNETNLLPCTVSCCVSNNDHLTVRIEAANALNGGINGNKQTRNNVQSYTRENALKIGKPNRAECYIYICTFQFIEQHSGCGGAMVSTRWSADELHQKWRALTGRCTFYGFFFYFAAFIQFTAVWTISMGFFFYYRSSCVSWQRSDCSGGCRGVHINGEFV